MKQPFLHNSRRVWVCGWLVWRHQSLPHHQATQQLLGVPGGQVPLLYLHPGAGQGLCLPRGPQQRPSVQWFRSKLCREIQDFWTHWGWVKFSKVLHMTSTLLVLFLVSYIIICVVKWSTAVHHFSRVTTISDGKRSKWCNSAVLWGGSPPLQSVCAAWRCECVQ